MGELFSIHHSLHPQPTEHDLSDWVHDARCAFNAFYEAQLEPLPPDPRHLAKVLKRRAVLAEEYARYAKQASFVADQLADQED
jgi:hypothetical protein